MLHTSNKGHVECGTPNTSWPEELTRCWQRYTTELLNEGWKSIVSRIAPVGEERNFIGFAQPTTDGFQVCHFFNGVSGVLHTYAYFGRLTEGARGCVHGGAICTMINQSCSVLASELGFEPVTCNLNIVFKRFLLIDKVVLIQSKLERVEGREILLKSTLTNLDKTTVYSTASTLMVRAELPPARF